MSTLNNLQLLQSTIDVQPYNLNNEVLLKCMGAASEAILSSIVVFCENVLSIREFTGQTLHSLYELITYLNTETQFFTSQV